MSTQQDPNARNRYGLGYEARTIEDWYQRWYGKNYDGQTNFEKAEGMSDQDLRYGYSLLSNRKQTATDRTYSKKKLEDTNLRLDQNYEKAEKKLLENYAKGNQTLDDSKKRSQQMASINLDKLKKYLPTQIKAQGLGGLGVSESGMLSAYNHYKNDMGAIESEYLNQKSDLDENYALLSAENEKTKQEGKEQALSQYDQDIYLIDYEEKGKNQTILAEYEQARNDNRDLVLKYVEGQLDRDAHYENFVDGVLSPLAKEEIVSYINQNKDLLGDLGYESAITLVDNQKSKTYEELNRLVLEPIQKIETAATPETTLTAIYNAKSALEQYGSYMRETDRAYAKAQIDRRIFARNENIAIDNSKAKGEGDNFEITLWNPADPENSRFGFELETGSEITSEQDQQLLNYATTQDEGKNPAKNSVCVIGNTMYIYTDKWYSVKDRRHGAWHAVEYFKGNYSQNPNR